MKKQPKKAALIGDDKPAQSTSSNVTAEGYATAFPLPSPMDLAKLAATLGPTGNADNPLPAIGRAMKFYVEAVFFLRDCPRSEKEMIRFFGNGERLRALYTVYDSPSLKDMLLLDPDPSKYGDTADPARQYLREQGLPLNTARAVLNNYRLWLPSLSKEELEMEIESYRRPDGTYLFPKPILQSIASDAHRRRRATRRESAKTRKQKMTERASRTVDFSSRV